MISRIADFFSSLEGLAFLLTLILGVGLLGYLGAVWFIHFAKSGQYLFTLVVAGLSFTFVALALLRVPLAQIVVLGSAVICGIAVLLGYGQTLLP